MSVLSDKWIRKMSNEEEMISPFEEKQVRGNSISYGLSSFGYDARVSDEFKNGGNVGNVRSLLSKFEKDVINVDRRVNLLYSAITGDVLRIFPIPNDRNNTWVSNNNIQPANFKGQDSIFVRQLLPVYIQTLSESTSTKDFTTANQLLNGITDFQKKYGSAVYPSKNKRDSY